MEEVHIDILEKYKKDIIDNVHVSDEIIKPLLNECILKTEDVDDINKTNNSNEKVSQLLDILPRRGPFAFQVFVDSLNHSYSWLRLAIKEDLETSNMPLYYNNQTIDLPSCPKFTVIRKELTIQLKQYLHLMRPGDYLAVSGLKGIGKSCLISKTLKDDINLVAELFKNNVFWITFNNNNSEHQNIENEILNQLSNLYEKFNEPTFPSRLGSESQINCWKRHIRNYFKKKVNKSSLLILDNVTHEAIVDAFDFGNKTLIITDDFSVVSKKEPRHLEVTNGFTETESLSLFAKSLDIIMEQLPKEAKQIHKQCKGIPLLIGMMVQQFQNFKKDMIQDPKWWQYFLKTLQNDDISSHIQTVRNTFDLCIKKLKPEQRELFYDLAVFNDDINIMPQTLEILWGLEPFAVDILMTTFCEKSLAIRKYNPELNSYIYGVHSMLLDHLRIKLGPETLRDKHKVLIKKYQDKCNGDFSRLPVDNYIHSYIGHHLANAELDDLFKDIYLDLKFIQSKLIHSGINDILIDIEKYKHYIIGNCPENLIKLNEIKKFVKKNIKILTKQREKCCLDVIQLALLQEEGFIFNQARQLAIEQSAYPYFSRTIIAEDEINVENIFIESSTHPVSEEITNICYTNDHNSLLWSTKNGDIVEKNFASGKICNFHGLQGEDIRKLVVSNNEQHFLALTKKGDVKLFLLGKNDSNSERLRERQSQYVLLFDNKKKDDSLKTFRINNEVITDVIFTNDDLIAACTDQGTVIIWNENDCLCRDKKNSSLKKIISLDAPINELFHTFTNDGFIRTYNFESNRLDDISEYDPQITSPVVFCQRLTTEPNSLVVVTQNEALHIKWEQSDGVLANIHKECQTMINNPEETFESAIITYDEQYLIIAKSDGCTEIWNFRNEFKLLTSCNLKVSCLDSYWKKDDNYHFLCGKEKSLIYKWKLNPKIEELRPVSEPLFTASMKRKGQYDTVARRTNDNKLRITKGCQKKWTKIHDIDLIGTTSTFIFSKDSRKLIYDIIEDQRQTIYVFDLETKTSRYIMKLEKVAKLMWLVNNFTVSDIVLILEENQDLKICAYSSNGQIGTQIIKKFGNLIGVHEIDKNEILTVTNDCVITYWMAAPYSGELISVEKEVPKHFKVISSTLSVDKKYLAVLNKNRKIIHLYQIKTIEMKSRQVSIKFYHEIPQFNDSITCFEFSKNEKYLAIGFKNGNVTIYDVEDKTEIYTYSLLGSCVKNIEWSLDSEKLILASSEKIAVVKTADKIQPKKFNRKGMCIIPKEKNLVQSKRDQSLLLRIIPLPTNNAKVFVSEDFEKILTVDNNGHVNIFSQLMISDLQSTSNILQENCAVV
ncbi:apoptotic protease-activating factor 1-like [Leptopilina heterotoma]|uniref:apoptotic protease-activating factor 1-like n=1 Tax=Leptopilina heterotoma TaxID=63436 RepID=UPI001CA83CBF|nr:apoptotic protease-activating factor 1-like [Leptopilina heterotoma]